MYFQRFVKPFLTKFTEDKNYKSVNGGILLRILSHTFILKIILIIIYG